MSAHDAQRLTAVDVARALHVRYGNNPGNGPEWFCAQEVRNRAGFDATRSVDFLAINTWPSKGHEIHGIEIKVSVSDWRRELDQPEKAEAWAQHCHRWLIAAPAGVIPIAEVPPAWGLIEVTRDKNGGLRTRMKLQGEKQRNPVPLDMSMIAAILRRDRGTTAEIEHARAQGRSDAEYAWQYEARQLAELQRRDKRLCEAMGRVAPGAHWYSGMIDRDDIDDRLKDVAADILGVSSVTKARDTMEFTRGHLARALAALDAAINDTKGEE